MTLSPTSSRGSAGAPSGLVQICDLLLSGSQASFDTSVILPGALPTAYTHLELHLMLRDTQVTTAATGLMQFNGDGGGNYNNYATANVANAIAVSSLYGTTGVQLVNTSANATAGRFSSTVVNIESYRSTGQHKQVNVAEYIDPASAAGSDRLNFRGAAWLNTAAITRIVVAPAGGSWAAGCRFTLYGLT